MCRLPTLCQRGVAALSTACRTLELRTRFLFAKVSSWPLSHLKDIFKSQEIMEIMDCPLSTPRTVEAERCVWCWLFNLMFVRNTLSGRWFQTLFIFHNIWDNPSHWLSYFQDGYRTTNQRIIYLLFLFSFTCCFYIYLLTCSVVSEVEISKHRHPVEPVPMNPQGTGPL